MPLSIACRVLTWHPCICWAPRVGLLGCLPSYEVIPRAVIDEEICNRLIAFVEVDAPRERVFVNLTVRERVRACTLFPLVASRYHPTVSGETKIHQPSMIAVTKHRQRWAVVP